MPIYEYQCKKCGHRFEKIQKFSDPLVKKCPECGGAVEQTVTAPAVQFKGSGWYVTDYAKKGGASAKSEGDGAKADAATSTEKTPEKTESKAEKKESKRGKSDKQ